MVLTSVSSLTKVALPVIVRRNFCTSLLLNNQASDPVQALFLNKIREFDVKIKDKNFVNEFPELKKALDDELQRVTRQYGGDKPEDLQKFPTLKKTDSTLEPPIKGFMYE